MASALVFANTVGNLVTGKPLTYNARKWVTAFPLALIAVYAALFFLGEFAVPMILITFVWGILAGGIMSNINQYLISSAAPEVPEFANGLFIASCNIGTTVGSAVGGLLIGLVVIARRHFIYGPGLRLAEE
ncbi:hypothetical protein [Saccharibacillus deserti]|uniref:hypothetical protein n=1 Tax=Saccharibacillus deserti TaxID=1634444 RepID=UPI0015540C2F|nr:hypothetical protein [Saccharibacillus deserti]